MSHPDLKILVSPFDQFEKHHFVSADMWRGAGTGSGRLINFAQTKYQGKRDEKPGTKYKAGIFRG